MIMASNHSVMGPTLLRLSGIADQHRHIILKQLSWLIDSIMRTFETHDPVFWVELYKCCVFLLVDYHYQYLILLYCKISNLPKAFQIFLQNIFKDQMFSSELF